MQWRGGALLIGHWRGTPIWASWTLPIGLLFFGGGSLVGALSVGALILVHELGHAVLIRRRSLDPLYIRLHGMGGECTYNPAWATAFDQAFIAWGGVLAQGAVLVVALFLSWLFAPESGIAADVLRVLIGMNAVMIAFNLLPIPGLDGSLAWRIVPMLRGRWEEQRRSARSQRDARRRAGRRLLASRCRLARRGCTRSSRSWSVRGQSSRLAASRPPPG